MLYGELHPYGYFRFVNFGHPPPLVFSAEYRRFVELDKNLMAQFLPLGLQISADHPDRKRYFSMQLRPRPANSSDVAEITLMGPGDILFLYTDGVTESQDAKGEFFSDQRLRGVLERTPGAGTEEIVANVVSEVRVFSTGTVPSDDITALALKYLEA